MTKYAQNLIGDWETEQFEPLRQVAQKTYQTNWDKLTNDFNSLNEQLAQNFKNARIQHNNALLNNARNSYMRMVNAEQNLANRGLTGSGLLNTYDAMNAQQTGQENNAALQELMDANKANIEGKISGLDTYARNASKLSDDFLNDLAGITNAEGDNTRAYRDLIANISESAANRAIENEKLSLSSALSDLENEEKDRYRKLSIYETLNDDTLSDDDKYKALVTKLDVPVGDALKAISSYNYSKIDKEIKETQKLYDELEARVGVNNTLFSDIKLAKSDKKLKKLNSELENYTYTDLYDLLYK